MMNMLRALNLSNKYKHIKAKNGRKLISLRHQTTVLIAAVSLLTQTFTRGKGESQHSADHCLMTSILSVNEEKKPVPLGKNCSYLIRLQKI